MLKRGLLNIRLMHEHAHTRGLPINRPDFKQIKVATAILFDSSRRYLHGWFFMYMYQYLHADNSICALVHTSHT